MRADACDITGMITDLQCQGMEAAFVAVQELTRIDKIGRTKVADRTMIYGPI